MAMGELSVDEFREPYVVGIRDDKGGNLEPFDFVVIRPGLLCCLGAVISSSGFATTMSDCPSPTVEPLAKGS